MIDNTLITMDGAFEDTPDRRDLERDRDLAGWLNVDVEINVNLGDERIEFDLLGGDGAKEIDLRPHCSAIHNQTHYNCCVAEASVAALEARARISGGHPVELSVFFLWFLVREMRGEEWTRLNEGAFIHDAMWCINHFGVALEGDWPFTSKHAYVRPDLMVRRRAMLHASAGYARVLSTGVARVETILKALASGFPVVFGTKIGGDWIGHDGKEPIQPVKPGERKGGHAMTLVGWKPDAPGGGAFIVRNSWGERWGDGGYGLVSPDVIAHHIYDAWSLTTTGEELVE